MTISASAWVWRRWGKHSSRATEDSGGAPASARLCPGGGSGQSCHPCPCSCVWQTGSSQTHVGQQMLPPEPRPEPPLHGHRRQGAQESMATQPQLSGEEAGFSIQTPTAPVTGCIALIRTLTPLDVGQTVVITLTGSTVETGDEIRHTTRLAEVRQQWLIGFFRTIGYGNPGSLCSRALTWGSLNHRFPGNAGDRPAATSKD